MITDDNNDKGGVWKVVLYYRPIISNENHFGKK
jgi:hypothetical protein